MKVILVQDIPKLGQKGEIKEVTQGYALNFLLPRKLALLATSVNIAAWEKEKLARRKEAESDLRGVQTQASRLDGLELEIFAKAGLDGRLYGGIGAQKIAEELKKRDFIVAKDQIIISEPIKSLGEHRAIIKFKHGLEVEAAIIVKNL